MTTAKVSDRGRITLPLFVRRVLGLELGDVVRFVEVEPGHFVLNRTIGKPTGEPMSANELIDEMHRVLHEAQWNPPLRLQDQKAASAD